MGVWEGRGEDLYRSYMEVSKTKPTIHPVNVYTIYLESISVCYVKQRFQRVPLELFYIAHTVETDTKWLPVYCYKSEFNFYI